MECPECGKAMESCHAFMDGTNKKGKRVGWVQEYHNCDCGYSDDPIQEKLNKHRKAIEASE